MGAATGDRAPKCCPRAEIAAGLIEDGVRPSGTKRARAYLLGMSNGTQIAGEAELYAVMGYFEVWGAIAARGGVDPAAVSSLVGDAPMRSLELLTELKRRAHGQPPLDGDRYEQLLHAITGAEILANVGPNRVSALHWQPLSLSYERIVDEHDGVSTYEATIINLNDVRSAVPGLCIDSRSPGGDSVGHWLVFPSEAAIQAGGEIEVRGRIGWPPGGRPSAIRFADRIEDFYGADGLRDRFPAPGGRTRNGA